MKEILGKERENVRRRAFRSRNRKRLLFSILVLAFPLCQFAVMGIYLKINSFMMAFQKYTPGENGLTVNYTFENFKVALQVLSKGGVMWKNSTLLFVLSTIGGLFLSLIAAFYIYKKFLFHKAFMCILFLPSVVSGLVYCLLFKYITEDVYRRVMDIFGYTVETGLLINKETRFVTMLIFNVVMGLPGQVMLFVGGMKGIDESLVEYSQIDGVNFWQEFFYLTVPMIFPTVSTFLIVGISSFFVNQMSLYSFYSDNLPYEDMQVFGYLMFRDAQKSDLFQAAGSKYLSYPELSAFGLVCTAITLTVLFTVKALINKFGPSVD
jgi:ABC-type sugar transport system permease subunit